MIIYEGDVKKYVCDFCSTAQKDSKKVISGQRNSAICDVCVDKCNKLLEKHNGTSGSNKG